MKTVGFFLMVFLLSAPLAKAQELEYNSNFLEKQSYKFDLFYDIENEIEVFNINDKLGISLLTNLVITSPILSIGSDIVSSLKLASTQVMCKKLGLNFLLNAYLESSLNMLTYDFDINDGESIGYLSKNLNLVFSIECNQLLVEYVSPQIAMRSGSIQNYSLGEFEIAYQF